MTLLKPAALQRWLLETLPLRGDQVVVMVAKGTVTSLRTPRNQRFRLSYTLELIISSYAGDPADVLYLIQCWLDRDCPGRADTALTFDLDFLGAQDCTIYAHIALSEILDLQTDATGSHLVPVRDPDSQNEDWLRQTLGMQAP